MTRHPHPAALLLLFSAVAIATLAPAGETTPSLAEAPIPIEGVLSTGQPTPEQLDAAAQAGVRTVINLRTDGEGGFEWEPAAAERLGLRYVHIPISGAEDLTRKNAERLDAVLREGLAEGRVLIHCASGNRVGALLALREAWVRGAEPEAALELGREAGLTRLEPETRRLLGLASGEGVHADTTVDDLAVRSVVRAFEDAWNRHDMDAFAALFAEDADFVNVIGARWIGRPAIKQAHQMTHATIFKNSHLRVGETSIRFLKPDVAVARSRWDLEGHTSSAGESQPARKGILTNVLVKNGDGWHIVVTQNTDIVSTKP